MLDPQSTFHAVCLPPAMVIDFIPFALTVYHVYCFLSVQIQYQAKILTIYTPFLYASIDYNVLQRLNCKFKHYNQFRRRNKLLSAHNKDIRGDYTKLQLCPCGSLLSLLMCLLSIFAVEVSSQFLFFLVCSLCANHQVPNCNTC